MVLAMTHEEVFTWLASRELRSYRDLPQIWYQVQLKFRDEPRPKGGVLRVREFLMKDSYSFDIDEAGLDESYVKHIGAYDRIFSRCGLEFYRVESDSGFMGGAQAHEYTAPAAAGEDRIALCGVVWLLRQCRIGTVGRQDFGAGRGGPDGGAPREVATPEKRTIEEVSGFLGVPPSSIIKALVYVPRTSPSWPWCAGITAFTRASWPATSRGRYARPTQETSRSRPIRRRSTAVTQGKLTGVPDAVVTFAQTAQGQHKDHTAAWNTVLTGAGKQAVSGVDVTVKKGVDKAFAKVTDVPGLAALALDLENVAAATYIAAIGVVKSPAGIKTAATIQPVEMQHATILNFLLGQYPVPDTFTKALVRDR